MDNNTASQLWDIVNSPLWNSVREQLAIHREAIIDKGKKARNQEKKIECWAEIEGFDRAVMAIDRMAAYREPKKDDSEE